MALFLGGNEWRLLRKTPQVPDKSHRFQQLFLLSVLAQKFKLMNAGTVQLYRYLDNSGESANPSTAPLSLCTI